MTLMIDSHEKTDIMGSDVPNTFVQVDLPKKEGSERVCMKIVGELVDYLALVKVKKIKSSLCCGVEGHIHYASSIPPLVPQAVKEIERNWFIFNTYDSCVCNRVVRGNQQTVRFHGNDILSLHEDKKVNEEFHQWLNKTPGKLKEVTVSRRETHTFLGVEFDFSDPGKIIVKQTTHVQDIIDSYLVNINEAVVVATLAGNNLMQRRDGKILNDKGQEAFYTCVARGIFIGKRSRTDIQPTISVSSSRVWAPAVQDLGKLVRLCKYLNFTKDLYLVLFIDDIYFIKLFMDSGLVKKFRQGSAISASLKQKLNTRSSTEAELIGVDDFMGMIILIQKYLESQVYGVFKHLLYQYNNSAILLEKNGKASSTKRGRNFNVR